MGTSLTILMLKSATDSKNFRIIYIILDLIKGPSPPETITAKLCSKSKEHIF